MGIATLFRLRRQYNNPFDEQQAQSLYAISLSVAAFAIFALALVLMVARTQFEAFQVVLLGNLFNVNPVIFLPVVLLTNVLVLLLLQRGNLSAARTTFVAGLYISSVVLNLTSGENDMQSMSVLGYGLPLVASGVLLRRRGTFTVTMLVLAAILIQVFAINIGFLDYPPTAATPAYIPFVLSIFAVTGIMLYVFAGGQRVLLQTNLNLASELSGVTALSRMVGEGATVDDLLSEAIALTHEKLGYYHVQIFLTEEKTGVLSLVASTGSLQGDKDSALRRLPPNSPSVIAETARLGRTQRISSDAPAARRSEFAAAVRSELVIPLRVGKESIGVLDLQSVSSDAFTPQEVEGLEALGIQLALSIRNVRLQTALQLANRDQQELIEQVRTASRDIERLNQEMSGRAWQLYLQSRSEKAVSFDWNGDMITTSSKPITLPERGAYGYTPHIEAREGAQYLVVPIVSRGQALGVMEFRAPDGQFWDDRSVELARAIAQRLALSLDNLRLYDQAQMAVTREQIANRVATLLQAKSDVDTLVSVAVDAFQQALGAVQTSVRLGLPTSAVQSLPAKNGRNEEGAAE
ncbi:MAG: GAF domain-containing protein [Chloroflexi bacterium CFX4]|nr:GAF domain-containing protein [Chloroflexi bacterium CFX4]MDL1921736.1 GAF domain-containing protein [Chloroflexi bacterium CFX3]